MSSSWKWSFRMVGIVAGAILVGAVVLPLFDRPTEFGRSPCQLNLQQVALGMLEYAQDCDEKLPPVSTLTGGWVTCIYPYMKVKTGTPFQCPDEASAYQSPPFNAKSSGVTDYYFNGQLQRRGLETLPGISHIVLLGDGNDGQDITDASYAHSAIPRAWRSNPKSPAFRHFEGANYAFVDGHVKWLKPLWLSDKSSGGDPSFQPAKP